MVTTISKMVYLWIINNMAKKKKNLKKNILITGGSGFIGSAITKHLVKEKNKVMVNIGSKDKLVPISKLTLLNKMNDDTINFDYFKDLKRNIIVYLNELYKKNKFYS